MLKINSLSINGIRGIKNRLTLQLSKKSILLYGENASGKSSITDAVEWFYNNRVNHLSNEEIGRNGLEALRNIFLKNEESGTVAIEFNNEKYNSQKRIFFKKESLQSEHSNESEEFVDYLSDSKKENLILRYGDLDAFIAISKKEKLDALSDIIGFSEVIKVRDTLRKMVGELKKEFKKDDFDNRINAQQQKIINYLGCNVTSDDQFVNAVNELVTPLGINIKISQINEIKTILKQIIKPGDSQAIELQAYYNKVSDWLSGIPPALDVIEDLYIKYHDQFNRILDDIEKFKKIILEALLTEGVKVIKKNVVTDDKCPLCLQSKNKDDLLKELEARINEFKKYKAEKNQLDDYRNELNRELTDAVKKIDFHLFDRHSKDDVNRDLAEQLGQFKLNIDCYSNQLKIEVLPSNKLKAPVELAVDRNALNRIIDMCKHKMESLKDSKKDDLRFDVHSKIVSSKDTHIMIKELKIKKERLEHQQQSFELIYSDFLKKQKEALVSFLTHYSTNINDFYQFMNPDEKVDSIKLVPLEKDDELTGITLEYEFFKNVESPPQKYLSESHLNCLGLAFFLTSVKAFNKKNKFFILDDVISSYDSTHRKRFTDLLLEKFSDYQIILLTHEKNWFEIVRNQVKGKEWEVKTVKWNKNNGSYIDEPIKDLKERIEAKIENSDVDGLGNDIRKYLEHFLKQIVYNLEVKMKFRFNDRNEERMVNELFDELKVSLKKTTLKDNPVINRLSSSLFIGNKESHDNMNLFEASINDIKAFWKDVENFKNHFLCASCGKYVYFSTNGHSTGKKIQCKCGQTS
jgi:recombinational DNA repair ATPase RecF